MDVGPRGRGLLGAFVVWCVISKCGKHGLLWIFWHMVFGSIVALGGVAPSVDIVATMSRGPQSFV